MTWSLFQASPVQQEECRCHGNDSLGSSPQGRRPPARALLAPGPPPAPTRSVLSCSSPVRVLETSPLSPWLLPVQAAGLRCAPCRKGSDSSNSPQPLTLCNLLCVWGSAGACAGMGSCQGQWGIWRRQGSSHSNQTFALGRGDASGRLRAPGSFRWACPGEVRKVTNPVCSPPAGSSAVSLLDHHSR